MFIPFVCQAWNELQLCNPVLHQPPREHVQQVTFLIAEKYSCIALAVQSNAYILNITQMLVLVI